MSKNFKKFAILTLLLFSSTSIIESYACTRVVYKGPNGTIITARSMDWKEEMPADLWLLPRGMERYGEAGSSSIRWSSKYGSVITNNHNGSTDGMNEKGLVGNALWLAESTYPKFDKENPDATISISLWLQYALDNFATVQEAVEKLSKEEFIVLSSTIPGTDTYVTVHLSLSDKTGDSAIFEYIDGELCIHHDESYTTMTNSPVFKEQLAINGYWNNIPGTTMLPGTNNAPDRFVRASYYMDAIPKTDDTRVAIPAVFSVIRNVSVPYGISTESQPNISSTRWRTVADQKNLVYYFENVLNPNVVWVEFNKLDFSKNAKTKKLSLSNNEIYAGETSKDFKETKPFQFTPVIID
ncbi:MAG: linear amide C-N hydrolase [Psychroserpens sp.]|uniref:linear amide C-N hydrolase n=1 Tax=Psychroserpens sp. TaxID=2020870 RepID=UPI003C710A69